MRELGLTNLSVFDLCELAGGDPWKLDDELQAGDGGAIDTIAFAFYRASNTVGEADDDFKKAREKFAEGFVRNGSSHPINEAGEIDKAVAALRGHREQLKQVGTSLEKVAAALVDAKLHSGAAISDLQARLHEIDDEMAAAVAQGYNVAPGRMVAAQAVKATIDKIETIRGGYEGALHEAETAMAAEGYVPEVLDDLDAVPEDKPANAADRYERSGQRATDQRVVNEAKGKDGSPAMVGRPGGLTRQEAEAAARLRDYRLITGQSPGGGDAGTAHARRLAGERLDDYNVATSRGPVPKDPALGGDARDRAKARLDLQQKMQDGQLGPLGVAPLTPDQATAALDQIEASDRAHVLARVQDQLQQGGMSKAGAAQVVEGLTHGKIPDEYIEGASAAGKALDGSKEGIRGYAEALPTGKHWAPGVAFSPEDVESLKKFGSHVGYVGSLVELGVGSYELLHGEPFSEVAAKAAGGWAGAWAAGSFGAGVGGSVGGPPGAFIGGLILGTAGAFGGDLAGAKVFKWLTE